MRNMHKPVFALVGLLVGGLCQATELSDLIREAIIHDRAGGIVTGTIAKQVATQTGSAAPLQAAVNVIAKYGRSDCRRLRVRMVQENVLTATGGSTTLAIPTFELDMCLDGQPPDDARAGQSEDQ